MVDLTSPLAGVSARETDDCADYRQVIERNEPLNDTFSKLTAFAERFYPTHFTIHLSFNHSQTSLGKLSCKMLNFAAICGSCRRAEMTFL